MTHPVAESWRSRLLRWQFNWFPAYRGTGARLTYVAADLSEVRIRLPLSWRTRNYVGTIFGGSMFAAVDPIYMVMLIQRLGPGYTVWNKSASIRFRRPGRRELFATFRITSDHLDALRAAVDREEKVEQEYTVELVDADGEVHAICHQLLSIRRREQA